MKCACCNPDVLDWDDPEPSPTPAVERKSQWRPCHVAVRDRGWHLPPWKDWIPAAPPVSRTRNPDPWKRRCAARFKEAVVVFDGPLMGGRGRLVIHSTMPTTWRTRKGAVNRALGMHYAPPPMVDLDALLAELAA